MWPLDHLVSWLLMLLHSLGYKAPGHTFRMPVNLDRRVIG